MCDQSRQSQSPIDPTQVQFYSIEMGRLADGMIAVAITATICPDDDELITQELHCDRTTTLEDAIAVIRATVALH